MPKPSLRAPTEIEALIAAIAREDLGVETLETRNSDLLMTEKNAYRDSNLTLSRTARRLGAPARDVSNAVNSPSRMGDPRRDM